VRTIADNGQLQTARLTLQRPTPADIDAVFDIHRDPRACAHNPSDMLTTRGEAEDLYHRWHAHWQRHGFGYWVIRRRDGDRPDVVVGFCGVKLMKLNDRDVLNLLYRLDPSAWGDGVATEAATAVVAWAVAHVPDHPVIARVRPDNVASIRVAERAGLRRAEHLDTYGEDGLDWIYMSSPPVQVRHATAADGEAVRDLAGQLAMSFPFSSARFHDTFGALLDTDDACLLVAALDDQIVGYLLGYRHGTFFASGPVATVEEIMVLDRLRRQGVGRALMQAFEDWATRHHCVLVALATRRAVPFYAALGYEESAVHLWKVVPAAPNRPGNTASGGA
jgi:[ribosomal protein S5]-alanine N-acetyltransferase